MEAVEFGHVRRFAVTAAVVVTMAFLAAFVVPAVLTVDQETLTDTTQAAAELERMSEVDCMDLFEYKMELADRLIAASEYDDDAEYSLERFEAEYSCEIESRIGDRRGEAGAYLCSPSLLVDREQCHAYSIVGGDASKVPFEEEIVRDTGCETRVLKPASTVNVETFFASRVVYDETRRTASVSAPEDVTGDLVSAMDSFGDRMHRIDVLRINCPGCDAQMYGDIFGAIADNRLSVGQVILRLKNAAPDVLEMVDEWRRTVGFVVTRKDVRADCDGQCADVSMIHQTEARRMYTRLMCHDASSSLGNHVFF